MRKNSDVIGAFPDNCNYILIVSHHLVVHCPFDLGDGAVLLDFLVPVFLIMPRDRACVYDP